MKPPGLRCDPPTCIYQRADGMHFLARDPRQPLVRFAGDLGMTLDEVRDAALAEDKIAIVFPGSRPTVDEPAFVGMLVSPSVSMLARHKTTCNDCGVRIAVGAAILWSPTHGAVHATCRPIEQRAAR